jgi:WD40 repeat protein
METEAPEKFLIFGANVENWAQLGLDREVREIENGLRNSRKRFDIKYVPAARPEDLQRALLYYRPTYVHFCGHGTGLSGIVLEGQLVESEALAELFKLFSATTKCVVLNACFSVHQARAIVKHVDFVVGMDKAIGDSAAIKFAVAFYDALGAGESVDFAFGVGCNAIQLARLPEHLTPKLLKRSDPASYEHLAIPEEYPLSPRYDWDGAPAVSLLYGRETVAEILKSWILDEFCRVVLITGLGGIGKTDLATCLGRGGNQSHNTSDTLSTGIQSHFDCVMWRSLLNAPPPEDFFADMLDFLLEHRGAVRYSPIQQLENIVSCLQNRRCFIVLDNVEAILRPSDPAMRYREGYELYGAFFEQVARTNHQSCLLLTSREKPRAIADLEGVRKPVRSLALTGIGAMESQNLFAQIGNFHANDADWDQIVKLYNGNPLALELAARHIEQVFGGDITKFLGSGRPVFADLEELLDWHLDRLSKEEAELAYWMAIEREPISLDVFETDLISHGSRKRLPSTLQTLQRRIPLERISRHHFSLQPVLIEHVTARLVDRIASALVQANLELLHSGVERLQELNGPALDSLQLLNTYTLVKATARENVRDHQQRMILGPVAERLAVIQSRDLLMLFNVLLRLCQTDWAGEPGYAAGNIINLLSYLKIDLHGINFSHLRIMQACLHNVNLHQTDFSFADFRHTTFRHALGSVFSVAYSPDGELIAVGDDNGDVLLFHATSGEFRLRCVGHSDVISAVAFSPHGQTIASSSFDNTIRLWDAQDGRCTNVLLGHQGWVYSLVFSPDGKTLASASEDGTCRIWDLVNGEWASPLIPESGFVAAVAFSPDGELLAVAGHSTVVSIFRIGNLNHPLLLRGHTASVRSLAFSAQGDMLASGAEDYRIHLWRPSDGSHLGTLVGHSADVMSLSFNASGDILASGSQDHTARLWSTGRKECVANLDVASARVWSVACSPTRRTLATGSEDGAVRIWDIDTRQCLISLRGYSNKTWSLASPPDASSLVAGNEDSLVRVWDIRDARVRFELRGHASRVWAVACSSDGTWAASASDDLTVRIWDLRSGTCKHAIRAHDDWIRAVAFAPDCSVLASAAEDGRIFLWDIATGNCLRSFKSGISRIFSIAFCKDGRCVAAGGAAQEIQLFSPTSGTLIGELRGHNGWLTSIVPVNTATLASCSEDGTVKLWDLERLECSATLVNNADVWCGAHSPRWKSLLTGTEDGMLRSWNIPSRLCKAEIRAHQGSVRSLAVNAAEDVVATTGDDGAIRLWQLPELTPCSFPNILRPIRPYEGMNISGATGLTTAQKEALVGLGAVSMPYK